MYVRRARGHRISTLAQSYNPHAVVVRSRIMDSEAARRGNTQSLRPPTLTLLDLINNKVDLTYDYAISILKHVPRP